MKEVKLSSDASPAAREVYRRAKLLGISQSRLAALAEVNETYVRDMYIAKSKDQLPAKLSKIAQALGCKLEDLTVGPPPGWNPDSPIDDGSSLNPVDDAVQQKNEIAIVERSWRYLMPNERRGILALVAGLVGPRSGE